MKEDDLMIDASKIHLLAIKVFKSLLETTEDFLNQPEKVTAYNFGVDQDFATNPEDGIVRLRLYFKLEGYKAEQQPCGIEAEYGIEFHFQIDDFRDFVQEEEGEIKVHAMMGSTLTGIAYSTSRGIIMERMQGTFFDEVILPVIDPFSVLQKESKN
ncbi:MAG: hypothetical protein AAGG68_08560 [Bacteroidota bacterium]